MEWIVAKQEADEAAKKAERKRKADELAAAEAAQAEADAEEEAEYIAQKWEAENQYANQYYEDEPVETWSDYEDKDDDDGWPSDDDTPAHPTDRLRRFNSFVQIPNDEIAAKRTELILSTQEMLDLSTSVIANMLPAFNWSKSMLVASWFKHGRCTAVCCPLVSTSLVGPSPCHLLTFSVPHPLASSPPDTWPRGCEVETLACLYMLSGSHIRLCSSCQWARLH